MPLNRCNRFAVIFHRRKEIGRSQSLLTVALLNQPDNRLGLLPQMLARFVPELAFRGYKRKPCCTDDIRPASFKHLLELGSCCKIEPDGERLAPTFIPLQCIEKTSVVGFGYTEDLRIRRCFSIIQIARAPALDRFQFVMKGPY